MNLNNKVAVIMSVYRSDVFEYIQEAVQSILTQSYSLLYLYIYRDGIVPVEINDYLLGLESRYENVFLVTSPKNQGLANALNELIDLVQKDGSYSYIARMDSDDISRTNRILNQVNYMQENKHIDVLGTSCREFGASFALPEKHLPKTHAELLTFSIPYCPFIHPTVMFKTSVFESGIRYPVDTSFTEDMGLWFILLNKGFKFANLNDVLLDYRLDENTLERRQGTSKAISEFTIRFKNMVSLKKVNVKNILMISARLIFHVLPSSLMKLAYKKAR
jgi:glycosyltransferase involved in cell wall biosynthesis